jgi:hypothetical protein
MSTATIETAVKMLATLPKPIQERAVEHLQKYLIVGNFGYCRFIELNYLKEKR